MVKMKSILVNKKEKPEPAYESIKIYKHSRHNHPSFISRMSVPTSSGISTPQISPSDNYQQLENIRKNHRAISTVSNYSFARSENQFRLSDDDVTTMSHEDIIAKVNRQDTDNKTIHDYNMTTDRVGTLTDLNSLNFTNLSSNIRRSNSSDSPENTLFPPRSRYTSDGSWVRLQGLSAGERKLLTPRKVQASRNNSKSTIYDIDDPIYDYYKRPSAEQKHTSIILPSNWTGKISSTDYQDNVYSRYGEVHKLDAYDLKAIIFRSNYPIDTVTPNKHTYENPDDFNRDAIDSLKSLDKRLKIEGVGNYYYYRSTIDWLTRSLPTSPESTILSEDYYRETKCKKSDLASLSDRVLHNGISEGQNTRKYFHKHLQRMHSVINIMFKHLPASDFPFQIELLNLESHYEKNSPFSITLYLVLKDERIDNLRISFNMHSTLTALAVISNRDNLGTLKDLCVSTGESPDYILSSKALMASFSKRFTDEICSDFQYKILPEDVQLTFGIISDNGVNFTIKLLDYDVSYKIELQLAIDVVDSPNVFELTEKRKWPNKETKSEIIRQGVHLTTKTHEQNEWDVMFMKTSNLLLESIDDNDFMLSKLLLSLQVVNDRALSKRGCQGLLYPIVFLTLLFWTHIKYNVKEDWDEKNFGKRFLDILIGLKRCLKRKECRDFILPKKNYFERLSHADCRNLLKNLKDVLSDPLEVMKITLK